VGVLTAVLAAGSFVLLGSTDEISAASAATVALLTGLAVAAPRALWRHETVPRQLRPVAFGAGLLEAGGLLASAEALALGPVSVAAVLLAQFATFAVILGILVLRERPAQIQITGVVLALIAVSLLAAVGQ
jgi:drug/metabolite transporter (DMT)-like permease